MRIEIISSSPRLVSTTLRIALHLEDALKERTSHSIGLIELSKNVLPHVQQVIKSPDLAPVELKPIAERIFSADAFIIVTPEYNGSYAPAMQNMFDHFPKQSRKPFGIVTASAGMVGGMRAAMQLQQFILAIFGIPCPYMLITPQVDKKFSAEGKLLDNSFQKSIDTFIDEFLWLAEKLVDEKVMVNT